MFLYTDTQSCKHGLITIKIKRHQQNVMTNDINRVWPNGILPYQIDDQIGKHYTEYLVMPLESCAFYDTGQTATLYHIIYEGVGC